MLPVEILDFIFSCLDVSSLEASSKAHPLLSCIAERHLHAAITLHNSENLKYKCSDHELPLTVGQLSNLLFERPHLANYVLSLAIILNSYEEQEAVSSILASLLKLKKMKIRMELVRPPDPHKALLLSLETSFGLLSMKSVECHGIDIPLSLLHRCSRTIEALTFDHCSVSKLDDAEVERFISSSGCPPLDNLSITEMQNWSLETLVPWVAEGCRQLRRFKFSPFDKKESEPFVLIKPILVSCSSTLIVLDVDVGSLYNHDDGYDIFSPGTLPILPHLRIFIFHGKSFYNNMGSSCLSALRCFLAILPNLELLILHLHFNLTSLDNPNWSELDAFFATCSSIERIILQISTRLAWSRPWSDHDMKPSLMCSPNISRMVEQDVLTITMRRSCYCSIA